MYTTHSEHTSQLGFSPQFMAEGLLPITVTSVCCHGYITTTQQQIQKFAGLGQRCFAKRRVREIILLSVHDSPLGTDSEDFTKNILL